MPLFNGALSIWRARSAGSRPNLKILLAGGDVREGFQEGGFVSFAGSHPGFIRPCAVCGVVNNLDIGRGLGGRRENGITVPTKEAQVVNPSDMLAYGDILLYLPPTGVGRSLFTYILYNRIPTADHVARERERKRHSGSFVTAFVDAHVEVLKPTQLFGKADHDLKRWNYDNEPHREVLP